MTGMGPNDTRCVIWAIGKFFLKFLCVFFYLLTNVLSNYRHNIQTTATGRSKMMGPGQVFFCSFFCIIA